MKKIIMIVCLLITAGNICASDICDLQKTPYNTHINLPRPSSEGFQKVSSGTIYYRYYNFNSGPLVILVPGLPASIYFSGLISQLLKQNFNVLSFDYPGKMNSNIDGQATAYFLEKQIDELFQAKHLSSHSEWNIIGTSMGSIMASRLALNYPVFVKNLVLLNPVGLQHSYSFLEKLAASEFFLLKGINWLLAPLTVKKSVKKNLGRALKCPKNYENLLSEQDQYIANATSSRNYLNLVSNFALKNHKQTYEKLNALNIPILIVNGEKRNDSFYDQREQLEMLIPQAQFIKMPKVSHIPFIEDPEGTFDVLMNFYGQNPFRI